jgi:uncharacterized protein (TIGR03437 family)
MPSRTAPLLAFSAAIACAQIRPQIIDMKFPLVDSPIIYALAPGTVIRGGVPLTGFTAFRSDDNGANWTSLYVAPQGEPQFVERIVVHPDRPQLVYAVQTRARGGLFRSVNGGRNWAPFNTGLPATGEIADPHIHRGSGEAARLRIGDTLYRLDEAAGSWVRMSNLPRNTSVLAFDHARPLRAAMVNRGSTYFASAGGGATWDAGTQLAEDTVKFALQIAFDPKDEMKIFLRVESMPDLSGRCPGPGGGAWHSNDSGRRFANVFDNGLCDFSPAIFVDPVRPNVYLRPDGATYVYCLSTNRGISYDCPRTTAQPTLPRPFMMNPRNGDLFASALERVSRDGLTSWQNFSSVFRPTLLNYPAVSATVQEGETYTLSLPLGVAEGAAYAVPYTASTSGQSWLQLGAASGMLNAPMTLRFDASALVPGTYSATVRIDSSATVNPSTTLRIGLLVTPRAATGVRYSYEHLSGGTANREKPISENAPAADQPLTNVTGMARDQQGNIFLLVDRRIRRIDTTGRIQTIAGSGQQGETADNTPAAQARFGFPVGLSVAADGTVYVAETSPPRVYALREGVVRVVADPSSVFYPPTNRNDLGSLRGICATPQGTVYAHDGRVLLRMRGVQKAEVAAIMSNFTTGVTGNFLDDCLAESDSVFLFSIRSNNRIYRLANGRLTVFAGTGLAGLTGDGGPATAAVLSAPSALGQDGEGNVIFADSANNRLRLIRPDGRIFTISGGAGSRLAISTRTGMVGDARFTSIESIVPGPDNTLLVADFSTLYRFTRLPFNTPAIRSGAAVNGASFRPVVSPGSLMTLYGTDLALATQSAAFSPLPTVLAGAEVLVNGQAIPITFASPGQVNAQIPPGTTTGTAKLRARVDGKTSAEIDLQVAAAAPGIFVYGDNRAVAQNQDNSINGPDAPEAPGRYAVLYLTGIGVTDTQVAAGAPSPADPLARPRGAVELRVGNRDVSVLFCGLTPGFIGLAQVNFQVPDLEPGDYPVVVKVDGSESNAPLFRIGPG